jgi:hypothetical protein
MVDRAMAVCGAAAAERRSRAAVCRLFIVVVIMLLNGCYYIAAGATLSTLLAVIQWVASKWKLSSFGAFVLC